jgi:hypothetical protein
MRWVRRLVLLAFALIQLFLVARILLDLGVIPEEGFLADLIVPVSDALAAPVEGVSEALGGFLGSGGIAGDGLNPVMLSALLAWTIVEGLVMRVVAKFAAV